MSDIADDEGRAPPIDPAALAHIRRRWSRAAEAPWLHGEAARRMAARLELIRVKPATVLDWCGRSGASDSLLALAYPDAAHWRADGDGTAATRILGHAWWSPRRWRAAVGADDEAAQLRPQCTDLLWANMCLQIAAQPLALMRRWQSLLRVDGFLMFSTLGPGSLGSLRELYARRRWGSAFAPFVDMHDLGDMLMQAGFADPVMDQEVVTLTWPDASALLAEMRALGGNADAARCAGLRTPRWRRQLENDLRALGSADGRPRLDFEIVYGHAFKAAARVPVAAKTVLPLDEMRAMVRRGRRDAPG